jgi:hypothetical protein
MLGHRVCLRWQDNILSTPSRRVVFVYPPYCRATLLSGNCNVAETIGPFEEIESRAHIRPIIWSNDKAVLGFLYQMFEPARGLRLDKDHGFG